MFFDFFKFLYLFAGKMHALVYRAWKNRVKGRDWYDFEWYVRHNVPLDFAHLAERCKQFNNEVITGSNVEKYCYKTISYVNQDVVTEFQKDAIFYTGERLLIRETGSYLTVVYLDENLYCNRSLYSTIIKDSTFNVQYVVGILNSKAIQYCYQQKFKAETELFPKIRIKQAKQLPIPIASSTEQQLIVALVEQIRTSKKIAPNNSIEKLEREIDKIVNRLYKLTDAEIKIIEQSI